MSSLHSLRPDRVIKTFEKAGWIVKRQTGSHIILTKEGNPFILSIPIHKGKPIKQGLLKNQIAKAGLTIEEFLKLYR